MAEQSEKDERTEQATPKRLDDARERGQVALSSEMLVAATLLAGAGAVLFSGPRLAAVAGSLVARSGALASSKARDTLELPDFQALFEGAARAVLPPFLAVVLPVFVAAALVGFAQVDGFRVAPQAVAFNLSKVNPVEGFKRMFGLRGVVRTALSGAKIALILAAMVGVAWSDVLRMGALAGGDLGPTLAGVGRVLLRALVAGVVVVLALSLFDLWYQRFQFAKDQRMTKKEVRDEHKSTEGDPLVKSRIRSVQREVASRRMMADVPDATVVVTNPTHFSVALRYEPGGDSAPRVVAKGVDEVALRIRRVAREAGVVVVENPPLARALHRQCELGDEIPEELFQAVAGVLAYVFRVQGTPVSA